MFILSIILYNVNVEEKLNNNSLIDDSPYFSTETYNKLLSEEKKYKIVHTELFTPYYIQYLAKDLKEKKYVYIFIPNTSAYNSSEQIEHLFNKLKLPQHFFHPRQIPIKDVFMIENNIFVVTRFIEGFHLNDILHLEPKKKFTLKTIDNFLIKNYGNSDLSFQKKFSNYSNFILEVLKEISQPLIGLHNSQWISYTIIPEMIWLTPDGRIFFIPLCHIREFVPKIFKQNLTDQFNEYLAPEILSKNQSLAFESSDTFSLGRILHNMIHKQVSQTNSKEKNNNIDKLSTIAKLKDKIQDDLYHIVEKATNPASEERYQNISQFLEELNKINYKFSFFIETNEDELREFTIYKRRTNVKKFIKLFTTVITLFTILYGIRHYRETYTALIEGSQQIAKHIDSNTFASNNDQQGKKDKDLKDMKIRKTRQVNVQQISETNKIYNFSVFVSICIILATLCLFINLYL